MLEQSGRLRAWVGLWLRAARIVGVPAGRWGTRRPTGGGSRLAVGHLAGIAAAAAARVRVGASVTVPVLDGAVELPTLGLLFQGSKTGAGPARHVSWTAAWSGPRRWPGPAGFETAAMR